MPPYTREQATQVSAYSLFFIDTFSGSISPIYRLILRWTFTQQGVLRVRSLLGEHVSAIPVIVGWADNHRLASPLIELRDFVVVPFLGPHSTGTSNGVTA